MSSIDELKSAFGSHRGAARSNRFLIRVSQGQLNGRYDMSDLYMFCDSVNLPGRTIATNEFQNDRQVLKTPYTFIDDEVTMTFNLTNDYFIRKLFEDWQNLIIQTESYSLAYKDQYAGEIEIIQLDESNQEVYGVKLEKAYPTNISAIQLANSSENSLSQMTVTVSYDKFSSDITPQTFASVTNIVNQVAARTGVFLPGIFIG